MPEETEAERLERITREMGALRAELRDAHNISQRALAQHDWAGVRLATERERRLTDRFLALLDQVTAVRGK